MTGRNLEVVHCRRQIVLLLSEGFSLIHMGRLAETFSLASRIRHSNNALHHYYELRLVSARGGAIRSSSGVLIWTDAVDVHYAKDVDALFALAGTAPSIEREERLLSWLRHTYPHAQVVHGIGGGQSALAMAGLEPKDGGFPKTGGSSLPLGELHAHGTTGIDAEAACALTSALSIVTHDCGHETASEVADTLLRATPKRFTHAVLDSRESRASDLIRTSANQLRVNSENRVSIAEAAQAVAMSERNFLRRFKQEIGVTPSEFVLRVRLEKACHMLVDTDLPADKIARRTGLGSGDRLAKLFRQRLSTSPTQYRTAERNRPAENGSSEPVAARRVRRPAS